MPKKLFMNTGKYIRFIWRRERFGIFIWWAALLLITLSQALAFVDLYPSESERQAIAKSMENPAIIAMMGKPYGINNYTLGALMSHQTLLFTAVAVAIMSILFMNRNTKADEESGRIEVIRSLPMGRLSNTSASIIVLIAVNTAIALTLGLGLYALGIESIDLKGSMFYGMVLGATGIFFGAITVLCAQLTSTTRGTIGCSFGVLGVSYFLRAIGDVGKESLAVLSPLGWILRSEVYVSNKYGPILLTVGISMAIFGLSLYLDSSRDLGAGMLPIRKGRDSASVFLHGPLGLGVRLLGVGMIAWMVGMLVLGLSYGALLGDIEAYLKSSQAMQEMFSYGSGHSQIMQFATVMMTLIAMLGTVPAVISIFKLKAEEKAGRAENILTRAVSRNKLLGGFLTIAIAVPMIIQLLFSMGFWYAGNSVLDKPLLLGETILSSMVYLPAIWVMVGLAVFFIGCFPRGTITVWIYYAYSFFVIYLGAILQLPDWMTKLSPYGSIPKIPIDEMNYVKITTITAVALIFMVLGFVGYRKRDIRGI
ncbi:MAG: ABC transporter permease [Clostridium sp.]|nr:ABC transporter permease [Clostridium sp.]